MTAQKSNTSKIRSNASDEGATESPVSVSQLTASVVNRHDTLVKCLFEASEISRNASDTLVHGIFGYCRELHDISSSWATFVTSKLADAGRLLAEGSASSSQPHDNVSEITKQFQRALDANARLVDVASDVFHTLSTVPDSAFKSMESA